MQNNDAWDITLGDPNIIIGITDDGFDLGHQDLQSGIWVNPGEIAGNGLDDDGNGYVDDINGWDFITGNNNPNPNSSSNDHGTHVAGIAAARTNNGLGVAGTAGNATVMPLQFYDLSLGWNAAEINEAFTYGADNGARIVTTSYNIDGWVGDPTFTAGLQYSYDQGVLHFNSAGNGGSINPARQAFEQTLLVASTESNDAKSSFSNYGTGVDIAAPGGSILSTLLNNTYGVFSGTSMASPNAAGAAALIWSANPSWSREQVAAQLLATADNIDAVNSGFVGLLGAGRVNSFRGVTESIGAPQVKVLDGIPESTGGASSVISSFEVGYDHVMDAATVTDPANYDLRSVGADGLFGTLDDTVYGLSISNSYLISTNRLRVDISGGPLGIGDYRLQIVSGGVANAFNLPLDGNGDGIGGDNFERFFSIELNPFERLAPLGSLSAVSQGNPGNLQGAASPEVFPVYAAAGETLAVVATPQSSTVVLSAELVGVSGVFTASAPGEAVIIPATAIPLSGDIDIQISGDGGSAYQFDVYRNVNVDALADGGIPVEIGDSRLPLGSARMPRLPRRPAVPAD